MYSSLTVVSPPAIEPITVDLAKRHTRIDTDADDDLLGIYIATARSHVEQYLNRVLITQTLRWVIATSPQTAGYWGPALYPVPVVLPLWVTPAMFMRGGLVLPRMPVRSVISFAHGKWGSADTVLTPDQYDVDVDSARVRVHGDAIQIAPDHTVVTFSAGYGSTADSVPQPITHAILMLTAWLYETRGDVGGEMPHAIGALLWPFRVFTFA